MPKPPKKRTYEVVYKAPYQKLVDKTLQAQRPIKKPFVFKPNGKK
jgi:hypothetical protein